MTLALALIETHTNAKIGMYETNVQGSLLVRLVLVCHGLSEVRARARQLHNERRERRSTAATS